jgi:quercetin dioxygenase-like cupin family protein
MTYNQVKAALETAKNPVARIMHKGNSSKCLMIGFNKGMTMSEHKAHLPSKLFVCEGQVIFVLENVKTILNKYDEIEIPIEITHEVRALEDSICLLIQG